MKPSKALLLGCLIGAAFAFSLTWVQRSNLKEINSGMPGQSPCDAITRLQKGAWMYIEKDSCWIKIRTENP